MINDIIFFDHVMFDHVIYTTSLASVTLGDLLKFVLILFLTILVTRIIIIYLRRLLKDNVSKDVTETILKLFYYVSIIVVIITILPLLGLDPSGLLLAGSITGIHRSSVKELFPSPLALSRSNPLISYSNHSSLNLSLFTCGSNA